MLFSLTFPPNITAFCCAVVLKITENVGIDAERPLSFQKEKTFFFVYFNVQKTTLFLREDSHVGIVLVGCRLQGTQCNATHPIPSHSPDTRYRTGTFVKNMCR